MEAKKKIIHKGKYKDNINCIKTSNGIENDPHVIGNKFKFNNYFTTINNSTKPTIIVMFWDFLLFDQFCFFFFTKSETKRDY